MGLKGTMRRIGTVGVALTIAAGTGLVAVPIANANDVVNSTRSCTQYGSTYKFYTSFDYVDAKDLAYLRVLPGAKATLTLSPVTAGRGPTIKKTLDSNGYDRTISITGLKSAYEDSKYKYVLTCSVTGGATTSKTGYFYS